MFSVFRAENEESDETARMRRLITVFVGRTDQKVRFLNVNWYQDRRQPLICVGILIETFSIWDITKTRLYNIDPLKSHFYIVKLGFTGVNITYLILQKKKKKKIDCGYALEPPRRCGSNEYLQSMFWAEIWKISEYLI